MTRLVGRGAALCALTASAGAVAWHAPAGVPLAALTTAGALYVLAQLVRAGALR